MKDLITEMQDIMCRSCTDCEVNWCDGEDKQECCWMGKIAEVGQTIEKEIRNKAIDEFYDKVLNFEDYIEPVSIYNSGTLQLYSGRDITKMIKKISEEMRGAE